LSIIERPPTTGKVFDQMSKRIINQEMWDKLYGKWTHFIQMDKETKDGVIKK
jgi:hypothetical protein